jgi:DNA-binding HxlR family transcriptional regulator
MTARDERAVRVVPGSTADRPGLPPDISQRPSSAQGRVARELDSGAKSPSMDVLGSRTEAPLTAAPPKSRSRGVQIRPPEVHGLSPHTSTRGACGDRVCTHATPTELMGLLYEIEHHRGTHEILLLLNQESIATTSRLRQRLRPGPEALGGALRSLTRLRLIEVRLAPTFPFAKTYRLTDRGRGLLDSPLRLWLALLLK